MLSELCCRRETGGNVVHLPQPKPRVVLAGAGADPVQRQAFEAFIAMRFAEAYGARIAATYPMIAGLLAPDGEILAACGLRFAEEGPLFLESYLDGPVEAGLSQALGWPAERDGIVEIGAFASSHPSWSIQLFEALPPWLAAAAGRRFAVATLRPELARTLRRAGFELREIADADPARLGDDAAAWGSYYSGAPKVYAGRVGGGETLALLRDRLRARSMERQARRAARASA
jgi:hypothetical protein